MSSYFRVQAMPASCGDCLWVEFGDATAARRVLIDGGRIGAYPFLYDRVQALLPHDSLINLIVVTHVDADHIEGIIALLTDDRVKLALGEIWFNGWPQIKDTGTDTLGAAQGELLSALLARKWSRKWNYSWADRPRSAIYRTADEFPPTRRYEDMSFTLLSPDLIRIDLLRAAWTRTLENCGLIPGDIGSTLKELQRRYRGLLKGPTLGATHERWESLLRTPFSSDEATNNGSSLAFLCEFEHMSCLFLGDAFPHVVHDAIEKLARARNVPRLPVGLMKVSHHGSGDNTNDALLEAVDCKHFLFSTDGSSHSHPDEECVVRIVERCGPDVHLYFNSDHSHRSPVWDQAEMQARHRFHVHYPTPGSPGITVSVSPPRPRAAGHGVPS